MAKRFIKGLYAKENEQYHIQNAFSYLGVTAARAHPHTPGTAAIQLPWAVSMQ